MSKLWIASAAVAALLAAAPVLAASSTSQSSSANNTMSSPMMSNTMSSPKMTGAMAKPQSCKQMMASGNAMMKTMSDHVKQDAAMTQMTMAKSDMKMGHETRCKDHMTQAMNAMK